MSDDLNIIHDKWDETHIYDMDGSKLDDIKTYYPYEYKMSHDEFGVLLDDTNRKTSINMTNLQFSTTSGLSNYASTGMLWYDTQDCSLKIYDGTTWVVVTHTPNATRMFDNTHVDYIRDKIYQDIYKDDLICFLYNNYILLLFKDNDDITTFKLKFL